MLYATLAFLVGITVFMGFMPVSGWPGAVLLLPLLVTPWRPLRLVAVGAAGFLWCGWQLSLLLAQQLPAPLENRDIQVEGRVQGLPEVLAGGRLRFYLQIDCYHTGGECVPLSLRARLNWYRRAPGLRAGERWSLRVRLKRPHGFANPGGFDYERWLLAAAVRATGYVRGKGDNLRIDEGPGSGVQWHREQLATMLRKQLGDGPQAALVRALGIGDRSLMSSTQWDVLRATGTGHLLAISGLHIGLVAGLVFALARRLWSWTGLCRYWPARHAAALAGIAAASGYALVSGFQVPAQRALIMITVFMLSGFASQRPSPWRVWSLALLLVLLFDPLSVLTPGFWLSFAAVAVILYLSVGYHGHVPKWRSIGRLQLALSIALLPLGWIWFQQLSIVAPLANLLAIPWVGLVVVPPLLLGLVLSGWPLLSGWLLHLAAGALQLLWPVLLWFASWPGSLLQLPAFSAPVLMLVVLALVCMLAPAAVPLRLIGLLLLVPATFAPSSRPAPGDVWMTVLDVGQGLSAAVQTHRHLLVFDAGPAFRSGFNTGEAVVAPYLRWQGYTFVDRMVISHGDNDHAGGAASLQANLAFGSIISGEPRATALRDVQACRAGQNWQWDAVRFEVLSPDGDSIRGNNASCVLRVTAQDGRSILLPGDIERRIERQLLQRVPEKLPAVVLLAPHHGSMTSSSPVFVAAVRPELVIFSTGYLNRFGFPKPAVRARYRATGAARLNTSEQGAIQVRVEAGQPLAVSRYRDMRRFGAVPRRATGH